MSKPTDADRRCVVELVTAGISALATTALKMAGADDNLVVGTSRWGPLKEALVKTTAGERGVGGGEGGGGADLWDDGHRVAELGQS